MKKSRPLTDADGDVRELTATDMKRFRPASDVVPDIVEQQRRARGQRGPQKTPTKERITIRLDADIVEHFRATGPGWQARLNEALKKTIDRKRA